MKKDGFLSTSLLYSFFLVFIAIIAVLLNNYIANKTILDRYNDNVSDNLNNNSFTVKIISKGGIAYLSDGKAGVPLTNLVGDGKFTTINDSETLWEKRGNLNTSLSEYMTITYLSTDVSDHIYTGIPLNKNHHYYLSYDVRSSNGVYVDLASNSGDLYTSFLENTGSGVSLISKSHIYKHSSDESSGLLKIGRRSTSFSGSVNFSNILLIDLTNAYLSNIPNIEWLDKNIEYFDDNINLLVEDNISRNSYLRIQFISDEYNNGESGYTKDPTIDCTGENGTWVMNENNHKKELYTKSGSLEIKNITDNITCTMEW